MEYNRNVLTIQTNNPRVKRWVAVMVMLAVLVSLAVDMVAVMPAAAAGTDRPKVVMVIVDRITVEDLLAQGYPNIRRLIEAGGLGLMTVNTGGDYSDIHAYVSLGGGDKFVGSALTGDSYNRDEILNDGAKALDAYRRNTGRDPGHSRILNTSIAATLKVNRKRYTVSTPGHLGSLLHQAGLKTAVIGNADLAAEMPPNRLAVSVAMDDVGRVDEGNVGREMLMKDPAAPFGRRTDYGRVSAELDRVWDTSDFIIVESGDTVRVNENSDQIMKRMVGYHRTRALKEVDSFIGTLVPRIDRNTLIMLVTPMPHVQALRDGIRLAPVIMSGGKITPGSVLTSPSTRQQGLLANFDVTATVISHLGQKRSEGIIGLPAVSVHVRDQIKHIKDTYNWLSTSSLQRAGVLLYFTRYQWIIYFLVFLMVIFRRFPQLELMRLLLAAILMYPSVILLLPLTGYVNPTLTILLSLVLVAIAAFAITRIRDELTLLLATGIVNVATPLIDVLSGGYLMKRAALSYDLIAGGRFYGIGNEYMGVVIGGAILGATALIQLLPRAGKKLLPIIGLTFIGLIVFFASPAAGSKAGGALTAMIGFGVAMHRYLGGRVKLWSVLLLAAGLIVGLGVLAAVNFYLPAGEQSHIGRAFENLFSGEFFLIWQIALRKLMANLYLLQHSPFTVIIILQALVLAGLYFRNREYLKTIFEQTPYLKSGFIAMLFGALAAIALNDSGAIAAPLMLNYLVLPLVMMVMKLKAELK